MSPFDGEKLFTGREGYLPARYQRFGSFSSNRYGRDVNAAPSARARQRPEDRLKSLRAAYARMQFEGIPRKMPLKLLHVLTEKIRDMRREFKGRALASFCQYFSDEELAAAIYRNIIWTMDTIKSTARLSVSYAVVRAVSEEHHCRVMEKENPRLLARIRWSIEHNHCFVSTADAAHEFRKLTMGARDVRNGFRRKLADWFIELGIACVNDDGVESITPEFVAFVSSNGGPPKSELYLPEKTFMPWDSFFSMYGALPQPIPLAQFAEDEHNLEIFVAHDMGSVMGACNTLGRTRWSVDEESVRLAQRLQSAGFAVADFPEPEDIPLVPLASVDVRTERGLHSWAHLQKARVQWNARRRKQVFGAQKAILCGLQAVSWDGFHIRYMADYRGRLFARPRQLSCQAGPINRSFLRFAEKRPISGEAARMAFLRTGYALDVGVKTHSDAAVLSWEREHRDRIIAVAENPLDRLKLWTGADHPLEFAAWCREWSRYIKDQGYATGFPVRVDARSSLLQLYALAQRRPDRLRAIVRDGVDYYLDRLCRAAQERLVAYVKESGIDIKRVLLFDRFPRSLMKTLSIAYLSGLSEAGFQEKVAAWWFDKVVAAKTRSVENDFDVLARHISHIADAAFCVFVEEFAAERALFDWLRRSVSDFPHEITRLVWKLPSGFPFIGTRIHSERIVYKNVRVTVPQDEREPDLKETTRTFPAGVWNALEASVMTVAASRWDSDLGSIFDGFWVRPEDAARWVEHLQSSMVHCFVEHTPLVDLAETLRVNVSSVPGLRFGDADELRGAIVDCKSFCY